jgi:hypothetical protein
MFTTNLKRLVGALAVTAGLLVAAGPANAAWYAKFDGIDGSSVVAVPAENAAPGVLAAPPLKTGPASKSLNTLGGNDTVDVRGIGGDDTFAVRGTLVGSEGVVTNNKDPEQVSQGVEAPVSFDSWGTTTQPTHPSGLEGDSNEVAVEGITLAHEGAIWNSRNGVTADAGTGDDKIMQAREPAHTVTMLDYMGSP